MDTPGTAADILTPMLILLVIIAFAGLLALAFWLEKSRREDRKRLLDRLGFEEVLPPSSAFLQRAGQLYRRRPQQKFELQALFEKRTPRAVYYYFSLVETSQNDKSWLGSKAIGVVSPDLNLPRLHIAGRSPGGMGEAVEQFAQWALPQNAARAPDRVSKRPGSSAQPRWKNRFVVMDLAAFPEINSRLKVMVDEDDQVAARNYLTRERLERLAWLASARDQGKIECGGDCIILERTVNADNPATEEDLQALLDDAGKAWTALV
ncbi:MAG: hypothetical protein AB1894_04670 [Chloroflexota bacterium]